MALGSMDILTKLILLIHEERIFFHLYVFLNFFHSCLISVSVYRSFTSLVNFIPKYFIVFDAVTLFTFLIISFKEQKILILMKFKLTIFPLVAWIWISYLRDYCLGHENLCFLLKIFVVLVLTFKSLIHLS